MAGVPFPSYSDFAAPTLYNRVVNSIPWEAHPMPPAVAGQWLANKLASGSINQVYHVQ